MLAFSISAVTAQKVYCRYFPLPRLVFLSVRASINHHRPSPCRIGIPDADPPVWLTKGNIEKKNQVNYCVNILVYYFLLQNRQVIIDS